MSEREGQASDTEARMKFRQPISIKTKLTIVCLVAIELLMILIIIFLLYYTETCTTTTTTTSVNLTCSNTDCLHTAADIMKSIDFRQEPCQNFYDFACGRKDFTEDEELDIFSPTYLMGKDKPQFLKKFRRFYESCVTHEDKFDYETRVKNTKSLLERIGSIRLNNKGNDDFNLTKFVADMILYEAMPLFDVNVDINPDDSTYILKLLLPDQTSLSLGHWSSLSETKRKCLREVESMSNTNILNTTIIYNSFLLCQKNYADYLDSISTSMQELDFFTNMTKNEVFGQIRDIRIFIEFDVLSKFDEIPLPPNLQELNIKHNFANVKVKHLEKKFPMIQWKILFQILTNKTVSNETVIQLYNGDYFEDVFRQLSAEKHRNLNNAFLAILANNLFENTVLPSHRHSREQYCKEQSRKLMPDITNYLYKTIANKKEVQNKNKILKKIYRTLEQRFIDSLQGQKWLDNESRMSIIDKLKSIELVLFSNDDIDSERVYLENIYSFLDVLKDDYQHNHFDLMEFRRRQVMSLHGEKVSPENIYRNFVDVTQDEPFFFYPNNLICIPYALFKHLREDLPQYLTEARVSFALAKMIGNAFDNIGIHNGVKLTEESKKSYKEFARRTRDMILNNNPIVFDGKLLFFNVNNDLSESERIADNTAMKLITQSSLRDPHLLPLIPSNFTREKLFYLYLVQGMCRKMDVTDFIVQAYESPVLPPQMRVANFLGNSKEFLETFGCDARSGMARFERKLQFPDVPYEL